MGNTNDEYQIPIIKKAEYLSQTVRLSLYEKIKLQLLCWKYNMMPAAMQNTMSIHVLSAGSATLVSSTAVFSSMSDFADDCIESCCRARDAEAVSALPLSLSDRRFAFRVKPVPIPVQNGKGLYRGTAPFADVSVPLVFIEVSS